MSSIDSRNAVIIRAVDDGEEVILELVDANSAAVLKHGEGYSYIIVPLTRTEQ